MNRILEKKELAPSIKQFVIEAPLIARKARPGQFVVLRTDERGERIPLTITDARAADGTLVIVFQEVGKSTRQMGRLEPGDTFADVVGPLGTPSHIEKFGTVVCIGGGVGIPLAFPIARAMREAGNRVVTIIGARSRDLLILEDWMRRVSDEVLVTTDDGSHGRKGFVTDALAEVIAREHVDEVVAIGPAIMMKMVALATKPHNIRTIVSLNPIMVDATGMCGVCRVEVGGETKFGCVDGPEFDGHLVNFDLLIARLRTYLPQEREAAERYEQHICRGGLHG